MKTPEVLAAWHDHLTHARRRSAHTVRAYVATARRLVMTRAEPHDWAALGAIAVPELRAHLAARREQGLGNVAAARELSALKAFIA
ncbi:site-specific integrase, partial [Streptomyces brasiliscabiei]|uniref:site-specific integrase n=1 Tax=Streptomyces brasiliscabiei TaxID=2736302 RepID=UPI003015388D